ncbi:MAG: outer membrane lipoprotein carrier protein LolA [Bacteroidota bacterium]
MKRIMLLAICGFIVTGLSAQEKNDYSSSTQSDPAAKAVLDKVRAKFEGYSSLEAEFSLVIELPEEPKEVQKGKLQQKGEKFRLNLESHGIVSDGQSIWLHIKNAEEVQISDVEEGDGDLLSPKDLLQIYESEDYVYVLANEFMENNRPVQQIEFKPLDRDSEYSKLRMTLDKKSADIVRIKVFAKDGSRYTLNMNKMKPNVSFAADHFTWTKKECPSCYVEDLRL